MYAQVKEDTRLYSHRKAAKFFRHGFLRAL
jgi:hypothetical protein